MVDEDPGLVTLYVTHRRALFPFRTHPDLRAEAENILKRVDYRLLPLAGWSCDTVLDVGANFGAFSLFSAIHYSPRRIVAYEPAAATFRVLQKNLAGIPGFEAHNAGLLDRDQRAWIHHGANPALHSLYATGATRGMGEEVELRRARTELAARGIERLSVLKVDTEGAEVAILGDLEAVLAATDFVLFEYHSEPDRRRLDELLGQRFVLYGGFAVRPGLGTFKYAAREVLDRYPIRANPGPQDSR